MRIVALLIALAELVGAAPALFLAAMSLMLFDAPGSDSRGDLWFAFWSICALPLALVIGAGLAIAAAIRYTRRRLILSVAVPGTSALLATIALATIR